LANAAISLALLSPIALLAFCLLVMPAIAHVVAEAQRLQGLKAAEQIFSSDPIPKTWLAGLSDTDIQKCSKVANRSHLNSLIETQHVRLIAYLENLGYLELVITRQFFGNETDIFSPSALPLPRITDGQEAISVAQSHNQDQSQGSADRHPSSGKSSVRVSGKEFKGWDVKPMKQVLQLMKEEQTDDDTGDLREIQFSLIYITIALILWTTITFGGIAVWITGVRPVTRDGLRMSLLRSLWRACLIYAPVLVLLYIIYLVPPTSPENFWWSTQLKRLFWTLPVAYMACTLLPSGRTPIDRLAGTAAVSK
jgi:hypothetical protein